MKNNKKLVALTVAFLLFGCGGDDEGGSSPPSNGVTPSDPPVQPSEPPVQPSEPPEGFPTPEIPAVMYGRVVFSGVGIKGLAGVESGLVCNGQAIDEQGVFTYSDHDSSVQCHYGVISLVNKPVSTLQPIIAKGDFVETFDAADLLESDEKKEFAGQLLSSIDQCSSDISNLCLISTKSVLIEDYYGRTQAESGQISDEVQTDVIDKAPSSHVNNTIIPAVSPGTSSNLSDPNAFLSASAESAYEYQLPAELQTPTSGVLTDALGRPLAGIAYFTASSRGVTGADGMMNYRWGETITFGIDTFTFGEVKGNQISYKLTDVSESLTVKQNIQALIERYGQVGDESVSFGDEVAKVFAQYPNVINEILKLNLPNGSKIEDTNFVTPNDFFAQFEEGQLKEIDAKLAKGQYSRSHMYSESDFRKPRGKIQADLANLYNGVEHFHVFHNIAGYYGASGYASLRRNLGISNRAFPILMPRSDNDFWQNIGQEQAWDDFGAPYIIDATLIDPDNNVTMQRPPLITASNISFNTPGITMGQIGNGSVIFMGNVLYPSVLSCPDSFWGAKSLSISEGKCIFDKGMTDPTASPMYDDGNMERFMRNLFTLLSPSYQRGAKTVSIATNIEKALRFDPGHAIADLDNSFLMYPFFIDERFNVNLTQLSSGGYSSLDPSSTPILLLQSYVPSGFGDGMETQTISDISRPQLTSDDIMDLITYVDQGGHIIFVDAIKELNPEPIAQLADAAGVALGGDNVARATTRQAYCNDGYYCQSPDGVVIPTIHGDTTRDLVVYEYIPAEELTSEYVTVNQDGTLTWLKKPKPAIAHYEVDSTDSNGVITKKKKYAFIEVKDEAEKMAAIAEIQARFPQTKVCSDPFPYEVGCIEVRSGHQVETRGSYGRPNFTRYHINSDILGAMVKSANLGENATKLLEHEIYFRSRGKKGHRLSETELKQTYDNFSAWMWNDEPYRYESGLDDELGFKSAVELLNCYTNDQHGGNSSCSPDLRQRLMDNQLLHANGELNPSYPLNYKEKPLTRIMLGRAYWDMDIKVDTTMYPGRPQGAAGAGSINLSTHSNPVTGSAGTMQSTGLWAPQHGQVTVNGGTSATITVALVDDLTGRAQHEVALKRPPRVLKHFKYDGVSTSFVVPFGGLIYVTPTATNSDSNATATFTFNGVQKASFWQDGLWINPINPDVPLAEIDSGHMIYTTPVTNVTGADITDFVKKINSFAEGASDFYGRDQLTSFGDHRRLTGEHLPGHRHRFVNDIQISVGAAHSGYPVQSSTFEPGSTTIPTKPDNDWLLWHEIGHNLASEPLNVTGAGEVANNVLALYMQEQRPAPHDKMGRIELDIKKIPSLLAQHNGHLWSAGDAGVRLVMFGQLKIWAEQHFDLTTWYDVDTDSIPNVFGDDQGWNFIKLMHRKARGDTIGDSGKNYCSADDTDLRDGDLLMVCASYVSGYDLSSFFKAWNPGETKTVYPSGDVSYTGGITSSGYNVLSELSLNAPSQKPEAIDHL